jgi:hypothetical protein
VASLPPGGGITLPGTGTGGYIEFEIIFDPTTNTNAFAVQFAQATSSATASIVRAGSYIEYMHN